MAAKMNCHGLSSDQIADVLNQDTRTIETWLNAIGKKVEKFLYICLFSHSVKFLCRWMSFGHI